MKYSSENNGVIKAVCTSKKTGMRKKDVGTGLLVENSGLKDDAHASGKTDRQVSLLAMESIKKMQDMGVDVGPGDFAENITTQGIDLLGIPVGSMIRMGKDAVLKITRHGKECHAPCAIYRQAGTCVMPTEGIFATVISGGTISTGDCINEIPIQT